MKRLTIEDFITTKVNEEYSKNQFKQYNKLSDSQLDKIISLIPFIGKKVTYMRGSKPIEMILVHIPTKLGEKDSTGIYSSYPYNIRLNYANPPKRGIREWDGFWTYNIDKIITNFE